MPTATIIRGSYNWATLDALYRKSVPPYGAYNEERLRDSGWDLATLDAVEGGMKGFALHIQREAVVYLKSLTRIGATGERVSLRDLILDFRGGTPPGRAAGLVSFTNKTAAKLCDTMPEAIAAELAAMQAAGELTVAWESDDPASVPSVYRWTGPS